MKRQRTDKAVVNSRRGSVMVVAAICLLVTAAVLATAIKLAVSGRRQVRQDQLQVQAVWLAEAGLERASAQLAVQEDYAGETWVIDAADLDGVHRGRVVIEVEPGEEAGNPQQVTVRAVYPADATPSAQRTRTASVSRGR